MYKFNIKDLTTEIVMLKSVTTALGGSITIIQDNKKIRIPVPMALARTLQLTHKQSQYLQPIPLAITRYDGHVVSLERRSSLNEDRYSHISVTGEQSEWIPASYSNIDNIKNIINEYDSEWFIDGAYIYTVVSKNDSSLNLTETGQFSEVLVDAIKLADIGQPRNLGEINNSRISTRSCIAFNTKSKQFISPPIWKNLSSMGVKQISAYHTATDTEVDDRIHAFDAIDRFLCVNLAFGIYAGKQISELFGFASIEPLKLPDVMIDLDTVNLPKLDKSVKQTYDIGMLFTHAIAWTIGLLYQTQDFNQLTKIRAVMKMLTTKGIYRKHAFISHKIFVNDYQGTDVELTDITLPSDNQKILKISH